MKLFWIELRKDRENRQRLERVEEKIDKLLEALDDHRKTEDLARRAYLRIALALEESIRVASKKAYQEPWWRSPTLGVKTMSGDERRPESGGRMEERESEPAIAE